ncbi:glutamyl-tRNA reductase [Halorubrum amylolyticum]|uniref:glutamyl-tRNA reductase n=1 Tax=Halorubrum amylolyticum TaxID=2508724 RepID=UPI001008D95F|nr:glutamyl-tRNA reductase [Halorubrum amylolyticum]
MSTNRSEGTPGPTGSATDRTEADSDRSESSPDPERLRKRLRRRTDEIERREVEEAVSALDARGDLTEEQRETVRELGSALVEELTAAPERTLVRAARAEGLGGRERTRAIRRLFDLDEA